MKRYTMNKIAQLIITLSVSFCAMSCIEKVGTELPDTSDYITVTSEVDMQTKAGYEGTSVLPSSFTMTIKQGTGSANPYTMNRAGTSSNHYNFSDNAPTWTTPDVSQVSIKAITASEEDVADGILDFSVQTDQSSNSAVQSSDLLGAKTGAGITISGNNVNVAFNHLMSKLQVSYTSELEIDHIELVNVAVAGKYNYTTMMHEYPVSSAGTTVTLGTITKMFQNNNSAEAIFFPFDPKENNVTPELRIHIKGTETLLTRKIILKDGSRFLPGKLYMVNISISSNSEVKIENWGANTNVQIPGERVLWIGTSIPAASGYPEMVAEALNCTVINNAVGGSRLLGMPLEMTTEMAQIGYTGPGSWVTINYDQWPEHGWNHLFAGGLSQTKNEAYNLYRSTLMQLSGNNTSWVNTEIKAIQDLSYETLIIPYINGEKDNCTTVIIDHGFNDLYGLNDVHGLSWEAGGHTSNSDYTYGSTFLTQLKNKEISYEYYKNWVGGVNKYLSPETSYILAMKKIIDAIRAENPNVRIIIGNYFSLDSPWVRKTYYQDQTHKKTSGIICYFNEAIAGMFDLDIVNVYKYLWIPDDMFWNPDHYTYPDLDYSKFCPDGVHPTNPDAARAIADVYINALDGVIGSRVN